MKEYLIPYIIFNLFALVLIFICLKWVKTARLLFVILFIAAGFINFFICLTEPVTYVSGFGPVAIPIYKKFIYGAFSENAKLIVSLIATGQILIAVFLSLEKKLFLAGIIGGMIFFIAIAPLGFGSAFPSTLLMAIALYILYKKTTKRLRH